MHPETGSTRFAADTPPAPTAFPLEVPVCSRLDMMSYVLIAGLMLGACTDTSMPVGPPAHAPAFDVVASSSGTLVIANNTTLRGDHYGNISITADSVTLDCAGHTVFGPGVSGFSGGIEVDGRTGVTVKRCTVTGFTVNGIFGGGTSNSTFTANLIYGNGANGIHLDSGNRNVFVGNVSRSNRGIGIAQTRATQSRVEANTVEGNAIYAGIGLLNASHDNVVISNTAVGNAVGYLLDDSANANLVRNNTARSNPNNGFFIRGSTNNIVVANTAEQNGVGFTLFDDSANQLRGNNAIANKSFGFEVLRRSRDNTFDSNTANRNGTGFAIYDSASANTITHNVANANTDQGFLFDTADSNTVTANTGNSNGSVGFFVAEGSSFNTLTGNIGHQNADLDAQDDRSGTGNQWAHNDFGTTAGIPEGLDRKGCDTLALIAVNDWVLPLAPGLIPPDASLQFGSTFFQGTQVIFGGGVLYGNGPASVVVGYDVNGVAPNPFRGGKICVVETGPVHHTIAHLTLAPGVKGPPGLQVTQESFAFPRAPDNGYILLRYTFTNKGTAPIANLYSGFLADWDILLDGSPFTDHVRYDATLGLGEATEFDTLSYPQIFGIVPLGPSGPSSFVGWQGGPDPNPATLAGYFAFLAGGLNLAVPTDPVDIREMMGLGRLTLAPGQRTVAYFAIVGGATRGAFQRNVAAARAKASELGFCEQGGRKGPGHSCVD